MAYRDKEKQREYARKHYLFNKQKMKERAKEHSIKAKETAHSVIADYLRVNPCVDCSEADIVVLEFDHRERDKKEFNVSDGVKRGLSLDRIMLEIAKCDVRCANCHRRKTYKECGYSHRT